MKETGRQTRLANSQHNCGHTLSVAWGSGQCGRPHRDLAALTIATLVAAQGWGEMPRCASGVR